MQVSKPYRIVTANKTKEFATIPAAYNWMDKHGGELEFFNTKWYNPNKPAEYVGQVQDGEDSFAVYKNVSL